MAGVSPDRSLDDERSSRLRYWGTNAWMAVGIIALSVIVYSAMAAMAGLMVPLVIATVLGTLATPLVDILERRGVKRGVGAVIVILALFVAIAVSMVIAVRGVIDQSDEISRQLTAGFASIDNWLEDLDIDTNLAGSAVGDSERFGRDLIPGLATYASTAFSSLISFLIGSFIAVFLLYFVLADWDGLRSWVGRHLGVPADLGDDIIGDATFAVRQGFYALSVSSVITAVLIGIAMAILGLPLVFTVALVTFITSYIPYLGAIFSGLFACLVALGAGGPTEALIILAVILVVQNVVQTVAQTKLTSDRLSIHPMANLMATIVGASLAGLLGATLSAPVLAMTLTISKRVRLYGSDPDAAMSTVDD